MSDEQPDQLTFDEFRRDIVSGRLNPGDKHELKMVDAHEIAPLSVTDPDWNEDSKGFWTHHGHTKEGLTSMVEAYPRVAEELRKGRSPKEIGRDEGLRAPASFWLGRPVELSHYKGKYFLVGEGHHRVALAKEYGLGPIPAKVQEWRDNPRLDIASSPNLQARSASRLQANEERHRNSPNERAMTGNREEKTDLRKPPLAGHALEAKPKPKAGFHENRNVASVSSSLREPPALSQSRRALGSARIAGNDVAKNNAAHSTSPPPSSAASSVDPQTTPKKSSLRPPPPPPVPGQSKPHGRTR